MKRFITLAFAILTMLSIKAQGTESKSEVGPAPSLEYVMELKVTCGEGYGVGKTQHGNRFIIPITGGTFEGPDIKGTVLPGGADYQFFDMQNHRNEIEAIYCIRTDDGVNIHIRNKGIISTDKDMHSYFMTTPHFEAPMDSKYNWLNNSIFVCNPKIEQGYISLKVWRVK